MRPLRGGHTDDEKSSIYFAATVIRLALCITELQVGGAERRLVELATRIDRRQFEPVVYALGPRPQPGRDSLVQTLQSAGVEVHFLGGRSLPHAPAVVRQMTRLFRAQQPQVVQTFLFHANLIGRIAARRAGVPHVVAGIRVAERHSRWHLALDRWTAGMVDRYVCVSQAVAEFSRTIGRLPPEKLVVIPNGIFVPEYSQATPLDLAELGVPSRRHAITHVGRLDRQKRVDWLLTAAEQFLPDLPDHDLLLVGRGPEQRRLEQLATRLSIRDRVHFVGWRDDVPAILKASDLLVLTSGWEGMPNVVLEAMASGLPVVATNVEGIREVLGPTAQSQVVSPGDLEAFAVLVLAIARNKILQKKLGDANQDRVRREFTIPNSIKAYEQLYADLVRR
ncbi:MAG: glycosyltransferase [Planctomycetes bacterium]|nr:glycosyltransferase [Planctomycetota bacterium]